MLVKLYTNKKRLSATVFRFYIQLKSGTAMLLFR